MPKKTKEAGKRVQVVPVKMRCPRCHHTTFLALPVGAPTCPHCGRPWFWPFIPSCKENAAWANGFVAKVEAEFKPVVAPVPLREIFERAGEIDAAYKEFVGVFAPDRKLTEEAKP